MQRGIIFDANSLLKLLVHYDDGREMPLSCELRAIAANQYLPRCVGLFVESPEWSPEDMHNPLHIRYEGRKSFSWSKNLDQRTDQRWMDSPDAPKS